jgi:hypothetical protein
MKVHHLKFSDTEAAVSMLLHQWGHKPRSAPAHTEDAGDIDALIPLHLREDEGGRRDWRQRQQLRRLHLLHGLANDDLDIGFGFGRPAADPAADPLDSTTWCDLPLDDQGNPEGEPA